MLNAPQAAGLKLPAKNCTNKKACAYPYKVFRKRVLKSETEIVTNIPGLPEMNCPMDPLLVGKSMSPSRIMFCKAWGLSCIAGTAAGGLPKIGALAGTCT